MNDITKALTGLASVAALTVTGCGGAGGNAQGNENGSTTVRMAAGAKLVTDWDDYVAEEMGFYEDHGITLDRISTKTAQAATQLLVADGADVGRGIPPAIQANVRSAGGVKLVSLADMMIRPPFVFYGADGISSYQDLQGKSVAMSTETDSTTIVTNDVLAENGLSAQDYEDVSVGGTSSRFAGLTEGAVQATALLPPVNLDAEDQGLHRLGYFPQDMGPQWKWSFTSVIAAEDWAAENENTVVRYLQARDDALRWLADESNRERAARILADNIEISVEEADKIYELMMTGDTKSFADRIGVDKEASGRVLQNLVDQGFVPEGHSIDEFVDDSYAAKAREGNE